MEPKLQLNGSALAGEPEISGSLHGGLDTLRAGRPIILYDGTREIEGDIAFAAAFTTKEQVNLCLKHARGLLCVALPPDDALRIGVQRLHSEDSHTGATPFGMPIDLAGLDHATSASSRAATIRATADRSNLRKQFVIPGHLTTLVGHPLGLRGRFGHTECILDLLMLAGIAGPGVLCEVLGEDGEMAGLDELRDLANRIQLPLIDVSEVRELTTRIHRETR